jgi:hypothetical protein
VSRSARTTTPAVLPKDDPKLTYAEVVEIGVSAAEKALAAAVRKDGVDVLLTISPAPLARLAAEVTGLSADKLLAPVSALVWRDLGSLRPLPVTETTEEHYAALTREARDADLGERLGRWDVLAWRLAWGIHDLTGEDSAPRTVAKTRALYDLAGGVSAASWTGRGSRAGAPLAPR